MYQLVTPFPFFLDFGFYVPLLLRLALGMYVLAIGFSANHKNMTVVATNDAITETKPEMDAGQMVYRALFIAAGISLIIGAYTQVSALIVVVLMLVSLVVSKARLTHELNRAEISLLLIIALSLVLLGAGPYAIDLPL